MKEQYINLYDLLQEIAWHFGSHGINGECCGDLSFVEFMALKKLQNSGEYSIQELANLMNFTKSGATRIANRLEDKGYIRRNTSQVDGRVCCVTRTDKADMTITNIMENYTFYLQDILKDYAPEKIEAIKDGLSLMVDAIKEKKIACDDIGGDCS